MLESIVGEPLQNVTESSSVPCELIYEFSGSNYVQIGPADSSYGTDAEAEEGYRSSFGPCEDFDDLKVASSACNPANEGTDVGVFGLYPTQEHGLTIINTSMMTARELAAGIAAY